MSHRAPGEGSIGKRKDGTYYGAIRLDGKRQWVYGETRREVADKLKELRRKADQGMSIDGSKITLEAFLNRWIRNYIALPNAPAGIKAKLPLSEARIDVVEVPGKPGVYRAVAFLKPHFQLDELAVSMRLVAELPPPAA